MWNPQQGLDILPIDKWEMRKDLTGVFLKTATATEPPYVINEEATLSNKENWPRGYIVSHESSYSKSLSLLHYQFENDSVARPYYMTQSFYGDIWSSLQQTLNFSYSMV